jgi:uncharacterized membrane protein
LKENVDGHEENWLRRKETWWILAGFGAAVLAILFPIIILLATGWDISYDQFHKLGVVGDFFGGTTVGLLSLASILFVTAAIVMQKEELKLQRYELKMQIEELERTRLEHKLSNQTLIKQQFDNTFFNMIQMYNNILKNISFVNSDTKYVGQEAFVFLNLLLRDKYLISDDEYDEFHYIGLFLEEFNYVINHYLKFIISLLELIHSNSNLTNEDKNEYIMLFFSSLSESEIYIICKCSKSFTYSSFSDYAKEYTALMNIFNQIKS